MLLFLVIYENLGIEKKKLFIQEIRKNKFNFDMGSYRRAVTKTLNLAHKFILFNCIS